MEVHDGAVYLVQYMGIEYEQAYQLSGQLMEWVTACFNSGETPMAHATVDVPSDLTIQTQIMPLASYEAVFHAYASRWPIGTIEYTADGMRLQGLLPLRGV